MFATVLLGVVASVGVIDSGSAEGLKFDNVTIETISTIDPSLMPRLPHAERSIGQVVAGFDPTADKPLKVFYASVFEVDPTAAQANEVVMDWAYVVKALQRFQKEGVKTVCTNFTGDDEKVARDVMDYANKLGITVVTSLGNGESKIPYPAMINSPNVIAVLGSEAKVAKEVKARANYTISGKISDGIQGSSYAAAKMCGQLVQ